MNTESLLSKRCFEKPAFLFIACSLLYLGDFMVQAADIGHQGSNISSIVRESKYAQSTLFTCVTFIEVLMFQRCIIIGIYYFFIETGNLR